MPWVVLGRAAVGSRHHWKHLALVDFWPASKMQASIHMPLCELSSAGFRQPCNVLQGMSWRAAKAIIKGNIIIPVPGMEKARKVSQKGAVAFEQNHKRQAVNEKWLFNTVTKPKFIAERTLQILSRHLGPEAGRFPWPRMLLPHQNLVGPATWPQISWGQALPCQPGWGQLCQQDTQEKHRASPHCI